MRVLLANQNRGNIFERIVTQVIGMHKPRTTIIITTWYWFAMIHED